MPTDYYIAWGVYLLAIVGAQVVAWRLVRFIPQVDLRLILQLCLFALLITPAKLDADSNNWVPAFMAAIIEGVDHGLTAAMERLTPIFILMLVLIVLSLCKRFIPGLSFPSSRSSK